mmetsp:Transcript_5776/g.35879  ORF Transcript_5776/g.35879 Transcript_5776/m.35879 type:complete len:243 (+) Transcript_5776:3707-4435(+)
MAVPRDVRLIRPCGASLRLCPSPTKVASWSALAFHGGREEMLRERGIVVDVRARPWERSHVYTTRSSDPPAYVDVAWRLPSVDAALRKDRASLLGDAGRVATAFDVSIADARVRLDVSCCNQDEARAWCVQTSVRAHWYVSDVDGLRVERRDHVVDVQDRGRRLTTRCGWSGFADVRVDVRRPPAPASSTRTSLGTWWKQLASGWDVPPGEMDFVASDHDDVHVVLRPHETWRGHVWWELCD